MSLIFLCLNTLYYYKILLFLSHISEVIVILHRNKSYYFLITINPKKVKNPFKTKTKNPKSKPNFSLE